MDSHPDPPVSPNNLWTAWNFEPSILIPLAFTVVIYVWGLRNVWRQAGTGRGINARQYWSFAGAILALLVAFISPLHTLSEILFSAHMVQHMLLILIAAPLLIWSDFPVAMLWMLPRVQAQGMGYRMNRSRMFSFIEHAANNPISAWLFFTITLWGWHTPALFESALENEFIHTLEHLWLLLAAMSFWWILLKPTRQRHLQYAMAVPYLFTTVLQSGILGALMSFTSQAWYPYYASLAPGWGLNALQDQQLAGLIMWIPVGFVFTLLTIGYFAAWLRVLEKRAEGLQRKIPTSQEMK